jgi:flagellar hook-associated protein 3 FlgL
MSMGALGSSSVIRQLLGMRLQLNTLQQQLGTGKKSVTYSGLGTQRSLALNAHARLQSIDSFKQNIDTVSLRLQVIQTALSRFNSIVGDQRAANLDTQFTLTDNAQTATQNGARFRLDEVLQLMNQDINGRYLFSGRATDKAAALTVDQILDGDPPFEGLRAVIEERRRADMGADNLGRLAITSPAAGSVRLAETGAGVFGFKIGDVISGLTNATATPDSGPPPRIDFAFTGLPQNRETVQISFDLPDGTSTSIALTATNSGTLGEGEFAIGADANATAANFQAALNAAVLDLSRTKLRAASALKAADDFFNVDATREPQRVDIVTTPEAATGLRDGAADTITWYQGDDAVDDARSTSAVRVDTSLTLGYGMRATESGFRQIVMNLAAFAAVDFDSGDASSPDAYSELSARVRGNLGDTGGQTANSISAEMAAAQNSMQAAKERNTSLRALFENTIGDVEGISQEEIATMILDLQTRLEASYQVTANLSKLSLVNFL